MTKAEFIAMLDKDIAFERSERQFREGEEAAYGNGYLDALRYVQSWATRLDEE